MESHDVARARHDEMPEPIPDTSENVARALITMPPKDESDWNYLKDHECEAVAASLEKPP